MDPTPSVPGITSGTGQERRQDRRQGEANSDFGAVLFHEFRGLLAIQHGEIALAKVPDPAPDGHGNAEPYR